MAPTMHSDCCFIKCFAWLFYCRTRWANSGFTVDVSFHVNFLLKLHGCFLECRNEQLGPRFFYVLVRYSLLFSSEIILKQLFASGSVNIVIQCDNQSFFSIGKLLSYINSWDKNWENYALWFQLFICIYIFNYISVGYWTYY